MRREELSSEEVAQTFRFIILNEIKSFIHMIKNSIKTTVKTLNLVFYNTSDLELMEYYSLLKGIVLTRKLIC